MNYLKILVPVVAVLVIAESVILFSGLTKKSQETLLPKTEEVVVTDQNVDFNLAINGQDQMQVGKTSAMEVLLKSTKSKSLDSLNIYVKYDPKSFDINNLSFDPKLPKPTFSKVSTTKGMVVVNFLILESAGMKINENDSLLLVRYDVTPKSVGEFNFEISTGNGTSESATMFVENATTKALPYLGSKLVVKVTK